MLPALTVRPYTPLDRRHPLAPYQNRIAQIERDAAYCTVTLVHDVQSVEHGCDYDCDQWVAWANREDDSGVTRTIATADADGPWTCLDRLAAALGIPSEEPTVLFPSIERLEAAE